MKAKRIAVMVALLLSVSTMACPPPIESQGPRPSGWVEVDAGPRSLTIRNGCDGPITVDTTAPPESSVPCDAWPKWLERGFLVLPGGKLETARAATPVDMTPPPASSLSVAPPSGVPAFAVDLGEPGCMVCCPQEAVVPEEPQACVERRGPTWRVVAAVGGVAVGAWAVLAGLAYALLRAHRVEAS